MDEKTNARIAVPVAKSCLYVVSDLLDSLRSTYLDLLFRSSASLPPCRGFKTSVVVGASD